jgi:hypothetical protein
MGLVIFAGWFMLSQVYGSWDAIAGAIDYEDDSGITEPGWYYTDMRGPHECLGPNNTFQGKECTYELGAGGIVSNALDSQEVLLYFLTGVD